MRKLLLALSACLVAVIAYAGPGSPYLSYGWRKPAASWTPPSATGVTLLAWYKTGGASGTTWTDSSGNGYNLTINGSPTISGGNVQFVAASSQDAVVSGIGTHGTAWTACMRYRPDAFGNGRPMVSTENSGGTDNSEAYYDTTSPNVSMYGAGGSSGATNTAATISSFHSACFVFNGASSVNNIDGTTATGTIAANGVNNVISIAHQPLGSSLYTDETVREVFIYVGALSSGDQASAVTYMNGL